MSMTDTEAPPIVDTSHMAAVVPPEDGTAAPEVFTLSREQMNAIAPQRRYDYVPVNELKPGARARVQNLNSTEVSAFEASNISGMGKKTKLKLEDSDARLVCYGWVDENGVRLYNPREEDEVRRVGRLDSAPVKRMAKKIRWLSGMSNEDDEEDGESGKD